LRAVIQRVRSASVEWQDGDGAHRHAIGHGFAILVGAGANSDEAQADRLADKIAHLRVFADEDGRSNLSLLDVAGEALVVSQFTLYADTSRGRRPSFIQAGDPARARALYEHFAQTLRALEIPTKTGSFGAHMLVTIENDGPVTFALSTDAWDTQV
jgi:D-tyrosyl-tRNA(Tyr) deacylase